MNYIIISLSFVFPYIDPLQWTKEQVQRWADWCSKDLGLSSIKLQALQEITGQQLCAFNHQQFLEICFIKEHAVTLQSFLEQIKRYSTGEFKIVCEFREREQKRVEREREKFLWCSNLWGVYM